MFPDSGPFRRELYPKHVEFFAAGKTHLERLFMAANRSGKTEAGAFEVACHLTGDYPDWWPGVRFDGPTDGWAGGINNLTTRDVIQEKLLGKPGEHGTGMLPGDRLIHISNKQGLANAVDTIYVRHKSGGRSIVGLKSFEQGRESWQGTAKHFIWLDEEPGLDVYTEALIRIATTGGRLLTTFTPLLGMSEVVTSFLEANEAAQRVKHVTTATWDDVPHLSADAKQALIASMPPWQRDARTRGIPSLGVGQIYPLSTADITVAPFEIPAHWPKWYAMDFGWKFTAALHFAMDRDAGRIYVWHEYKRSQAEPVVHAAAIKAAGDWIKGVADPAGLGSNQVDGRNLMDIYRELGLDLAPAVNAVESGIFAVWELLSTGRLKVFETCRELLTEFRKYHRDEKGRIVKVDDHCLDALRYGIVSGRDRMGVKPATEAEDVVARWMRQPRGWMT